MEVIGDEQLSSYSEKGKIVNLSSFEIRQNGACPVAGFLDLAKKIASLQYKNPNYVMLFRGQTEDHMRRNRAATSYSSLSPSLFRSKNEKNPTRADLEVRFEKLMRAEEALVQQYTKVGFSDAERLKRHRILRWALLQHYKICDTPLLDVTHSLRIAASFASEKLTNKAYVFVLGVPNLSGAVTASSAAGLQIVRLASVCPPNALRPHIQEGYLLGEYPDLTDPKQKKNYGHYEIDFGRRLVAKFCFDPNVFWKKNDSFPMIPHDALYPNKNDRMFEIANAIKQSLV